MREDDLWREAGRAVLRGAVCLALALSTVPTPALAAIVEELQATAGPSADDAGENPTEELAKDEAQDAMPSIPDDQAPEVTVVPLQEESHITCSDVAYLVDIRDQHLDLSQTTAFGHGLDAVERVLGDDPDATWDAGDGMTFSDWRVVADGEGATAYSFRVSLHNAAFRGASVLAVDETGNQTAGREVDVIADCEAPCIQGATMSAPRVEPSDTNDNRAAEEDGIRFFSNAHEGSVMTLSVWDLSGVVSVTLTDPRDDYELERADYASEPGTVIQVRVVPLREGVGFLDDVLITIVDGAGNTSVWSLAEYGEATVASVTAPVQNVELMGGGVLLGHPRMLLEDHTAPQVRLSGAREGSFYHGAVKVTASVLESNLDLIRRYDAERSFLVVKRRAAKAGGDTSSTAHAIKELDGDGSWSHSFDSDGHYAIEALLTDLAGNTSAKESIGEFTIDTVAPVISVSFDDERPCATVDGVSYYGAPRTATITVVEHDFDEDLMDIVPLHEGWVSLEPQVGAWRHDGDVHTLEVTFGEGDGYSLTVSGRDKAGNVAHLESEEGDEVFRSDTFTVDLTPPTVTTDYDEQLLHRGGELDGIAYYPSEMDVTVVVRDRNLDLERQAIVIDGRATAASEWDVQREEDDTVMCSHVVHYVEGEHATPKVCVIDPAGNAATRDSERFVIDRTAPEVRSATVNSEAAASGRTEPGEDPVLFYDRDTMLTFTLHDQFGIDTVRVIDPEGHYALDPEQSGIARGSTDATVSLSLVDGATSERDTEFERDILLEVTDIASNRRVWSIDRQGVVSDGVGSSPSNVSINDAGIFPQALIKDVTMPFVTLSGVEAGRFYDSGQVVHVTVDEFNFSHLARFFGGRSVLRVTKVAPNAAGAMTSIEVPASLFMGAGSFFSYDLPLESDGHYVVEAGFVDVANNPSNVVRIGEFTIDTVTPTISVTWDNDDVKNGKYYAATRTATIVVSEHNFDPSLIDIQTTGVVGTWSSSGDVHTCTVFFGEGAAHGLTVSGRDRAGNEARPVHVPEFVVDFTPPNVAFGGIAQRLGFASAEDGYYSTVEPNHAYNGVVAPSVTCSDDQGLDQNASAISLVGNKVGDVTSTYAHEMTSDKNSLTLHFSDFGRQGEGEGTLYEVDADDVYTFEAHVQDLAGNEAQGAITFSVNRFGSNYIVTSQVGGRQASLDGCPVLTEAPTITVREINVSGAKSESSHAVLKEFANTTRQIERDDEGAASGYRLDTMGRDEAEHGWAEYVYTIRSANFGEGSDSDMGDGGQGIYHVNVTSDDAAGNLNSTARFWSSDNERTHVSEKASTASFLLDELGPRIDEVKLPGRLWWGGSYEAEFHVTDDITQGDEVEVYVDGVQVPVTCEGKDVTSKEPAGGGTYAFTIPARSFAARKVTIKVSDYAMRSDAAEAGGFLVTTFVPECLAVACVVTTVLVGAQKVEVKRRTGEGD